MKISIKRRCFSAINDFEKIRKSNKKEIKVLNLVNPANSDGYNPLAHINSELDVDVIANTVVKGQKSEGGSSDPYWDDMAEMLLKALIYYLIATRPEEEQNLASCAELVRAANSNGGGNLLTELISKLPYDHPARMYYKSIEIAPEKTYGSILSTLQSKLGKFDSKEIAELTSTDTINFEEIGSKKTAVYVISSDTHTAYNFLLTIFFAQMIQQLYNYADMNGGKLKERTYFILDEFANIGQIPDFNKKLSTTRSLGISISIVVQSLDQLESLYKDTYENIIGNCDTQLFLGSQSIKTCEYFSKSLGQKTIRVKSKSVNKDKDEREKQGVSISHQQQGRDLMTVDELKRLDPNEEILLVRTLKPIRAKKAWYFKYHPMRDVAKQYEIHNISEMPKTDDVPVKVMDVREHLKRREEKARQILEQRNRAATTQSQVITNNPQPPVIDNQRVNTNTSNVPNENKEFDLQKELEKKFDELFGSDNN